MHDFTNAAGISRRAILTAGSVGLLAGMVGCSRAAAPAPSAAGTAGATGGAAGAALRATWWGSEKRATYTNQMFELYTKKNPSVTIKPEVVGAASYWDKLATQVAGGNAPDVVQMATSFLREYADRGSLLDLGTVGVDTSKFAAGTLDSGKVGGKLFALPTGINAPCILANPAVFKAANVPIPDDKTWTWEQYMETAKAITAGSPKGTYGSSSLWQGPDTGLNAWLRQHGKPGIFNSDGIAFTPDDVAGFYDMLMKFRSANAIPTQPEITEDNSKPLEQQAFSTGKQAMILTSNNVASVYEALTKQELKILRLPSVGGPAKDKQAWYATAMQWVVAASTKSPKQAADLISFLTGDAEAGKLQLGDRGIPANTAQRDAVEGSLAPGDKRAAQFLKDIEGELGAPSPIAVPGGSDIAAMNSRYAEAVLTGKSDPKQAAQGLYDELTAAIKKKKG